MFMLMFYFMFIVADWRHIRILLLWRSIASDEDVSESYGVSAAQSWTRKCDHTGGMQQQPLGQVFFLCGPGAYDRDPANVSFWMPGHPYEHQVAMRNGLRQEFPNSVWIGRRPPRMLSGNPWISWVGVQCFGCQRPALRRSTYQDTQHIRIYSI